MARTGPCPRPKFWRRQRPRAHKPPPQPDVSPDADSQLHIWPVRYGRCACAKTSGKKAQPRHPSGCLVLKPRDPGRAGWQCPVASEHLGEIPPPGCHSNAALHQSRNANRQEFVLGRKYKSSGCIRLHHCGFAKDLRAPTNINFLLYF